MNRLNWNAPADWAPPPVLEGRRAQLERLRDDHAAMIWPRMEGAPAIWRWLPEEPPETASDFASIVAAKAASRDPAFYAIRGAAGWSGIGSLMRIDRDNGVIEIGHLCFAPALQRSPAATEALFLMADHAFASGFRRLEWKCNARNAPSRRAARRLGFAYEGTFRQAGVVKGESRDTAWFAMLDGEWPMLREAFVRWLSPENFAPDGAQRRALSDLTADVVAGLDRPSLADLARDD